MDVTLPVEYSGSAVAGSGGGPDEKAENEEWVVFLYDDERYGVRHCEKPPFWARAMDLEKNVGNR